MLYQLGDQVRTTALRGSPEGVIVGRSYTSPPQYDVRTERGTLFNQPEAMIERVYHA